MSVRSIDSSPKVESVSGQSGLRQSKTINGIDERLHHRIVAKVGPPSRGKVLIDTSLSMKMHEAGFSYKQIGQYYGISGCTVKRRLKEAGLI